MVSIGKSTFDLDREIARRYTTAKTFAPALPQWLYSLCLKAIFCKHGNILPFVALFIDRHKIIYCSYQLKEFAPKRYVLVSNLR